MVTDEASVTNKNKGGSVHAKDIGLPNNGGAILFTIKGIVNLLFVVRETTGWTSPPFVPPLHTCGEGDIKRGTTS